jgi:hypothetical protein
MMKTQKRIVMILVLICLAPTLKPVEAALPAIAWYVVREIAMDTAIDVLQDMFKEQVTPEEVATLRKRLTKLEKQLAAAQSQGDYPSQAEFNTVKQLVANLDQLVNTMGKRLDSAEARITALEENLADLRAILLELPKDNKGIKAIKKDALDFKINYIYRSGGQGPFKTLNNDGILQSGDHYKIIFTPAEESHVSIFQVDSANKLFRLFPLSGFENVTVKHTNPVQGGKTYYVPSQYESFELDEQTGPETIYFVSSKQADIVLEQQYQAFLLSEQQLAQQEQVQVQLVNTLQNSKGPKSRLKTDVDGIKTTWQEDGQTFSILQQLQNMCNGCVNILTFSHVQ